jgi:Asp-tRNA(Asn)/Glu-tRNA(Gln) amidotransferase A subunit family amidase
MNRLLYCTVILAVAKEVSVKKMSSGIFIMVLVLLSLSQAKAEQPAADSSINLVDITHAEKMIGLSFTDAERDSMIDELKGQLKAFEQLRSLSLQNAISPALVFRPFPAGFTWTNNPSKCEWSDPIVKERPKRDANLSFLSLSDLAELVRTQKISSVDLTRFFLNRLKKHDSTLHCVITYTDSLALAQAAKADAEIKAGHYRGLLHGIPYGLKDIISVRGYPTTWGSPLYKERQFDMDATVYQKLTSAGAVLLAKLTVGEFAYGDVWFGGKTRNPWNPDSGSSGSSAGSASAVSAGLLPFAIGTETWGSIVTPSTLCGATGLRPTFGRISRAGVMSLCPSMDKIGPICRSVEDCAIVFNAIYGLDPLDPATVDASFSYTPDVNFTKLRIGYLKADFEKDTAWLKQTEGTLYFLRKFGAKLVEIEVPDYPIMSMSIIVTAEAAAMFDELTLTNQDDKMVRQSKDAWPNLFRAARFIPAVEYIQAQRLRTLVIEQMAEVMSKVDLYITPSLDDRTTLLTNLTGHPAVVVPNGFTKDGIPTSICFIGRLMDEATLLAVAKAYEDATGFNTYPPPLFAK